MENKMPSRDDLFVEFERAVLALKALEETKDALFDEQRALNRRLSELRTALSDNENQRYDAEATCDSASRRLRRFVEDGHSLG